MHTRSVVISIRVPSTLLPSSHVCVLSVGVVCGRTLGLFSLPIRYVYRQVPFFRTPMGEMGFWGGRTLPQICAQITSLKPDYWVAHADECATLYHEKEEGFVALCSFVVFACIFYCAFKTSLNHIASY